VLKAVYLVLKAAKQCILGQKRWNFK